MSMRSYPEVQVETQFVKSKCTVESKSIVPYRSCFTSCSSCAETGARSCGSFEGAYAPTMWSGCCATAAVVRRCRTGARQGSLRGVRRLRTPTRRRPTNPRPPLGCSWRVAVTFAVEDLARDRFDLSATTLSALQQTCGDGFVRYSAGVAALRAAAHASAPSLAVLLPRVLRYLPGVLDGQQGQAHVQGQAVQLPLLRLGGQPTVQLPLHHILRDAHCDVPAADHGRPAARSSRSG